MINKTYTYCSADTNPYHNLAVEEYLLNAVEAGSCILYLWQNRHTVVIGRNQNALAECKTEQLATDGGFLARRLSGGGSVYHDMGNLNFTFLVREEDYDVERQLAVIIKALETFGLKAERTGRNDICIDNRKFSGNAFYKHKGHCYHHGTILVDVDMSKMSNYLHVPTAKLRAHGVASVASRVVNLKELNADISIENTKAALVQAFGHIYNAAPAPFLPDEAAQTQIEQFAQRYAAHDWLYGRHMKADYTLAEKFAWGQISLNLQLKGDAVADIVVFSDAMDETVAQVLETHLKGARFQKQALVEALGKAAAELSADIIGDIAALLEQQEIWN